MKGSKDCECGLTIQALRTLLAAFPFHPILWNLYYTHPSFHEYKPRFERREESIRVSTYEVDKESFWIRNLSVSLRTRTRITGFIAVNEKERCDAYLIIVDETKEGQDGLEENNGVQPKRFFKPIICGIPRAWLRHVIVERIDATSSSYATSLIPKPFCCRQVLVKGESCIVYCFDIIVNRADFVLLPTYYHIGIGGCNEKLHQFIKGVPIYIGLKQLHETFLKVKSQSKNVVCSFKLFTHFLSPDCFFNDRDFPDSLRMYSSAKVRKCFTHVLVCFKCNRLLERLIYLFLNKVVLPRLTKVKDHGFVDQHCDLVCSMNTDFDDLLIKYLNGIACVDIAMYMIELEKAEKMW